MNSRDELEALRQDFVARRLERALSRLGGVLSLMNTGAHPDDEHSSLLAWLRFGRGLGVSILSSTRGEGGQNRRGPERGARLGLLRSHEMEQAAAVLDADLFWLGMGPGDPLHDFGFSKSGIDTLRRWGGEAEVIRRMVVLFRRARPDIILPTFLDVPGQHGHHRAMTRAALAAWHLAPDPGYHADGLPPWRIAKAYLPAWSGGGATYDDEVPPPAATLVLRGTGTEPLTGARWTDIGEASRLCHASQDMGQPGRATEEVWPLYRIDGPAEADILDGLPHDLAALGAVPDAARDYGRLVRQAQAQAAGGPALVATLEAMDIALEQVRTGASPAFAAAHGHRLHRQKQALDQAMLLAAAALPRHVLARPRLVAAGASARLVFDSRPIGRVHWVLPPGASVLPDGADSRITITGDAASPDPFHADSPALSGKGPCHAVIAHHHNGRSYSAAVDFDLPLEILPSAAQDIAGGDMILRRGGNTRHWPLPLPDGVTIPLPAGLELQDGVLSARGDLPHGRHDLAPQWQGKPVLAQDKAGIAQGVALHLFRPRLLRLLSLDLALPDARIAYIPGTDDSLPWLGAAGFDVTVIDRITPDTDLTRFDTVLVGVVAFATVPGLAQGQGSLCDFVRTGGHLVTLYQRPDQGWPQQGLDLGRLVVGTPSLRWRVTDPEAPVHILQPGHALLTWPNRIAAADWLDWEKERGLYFAAKWDAAYQPLLALSDSGEAPLNGALLSGRFGLGRHSHCALSLHHQIAALVPGAYRLLANLLQPASRVAVDGG